MAHRFAPSTFFALSVSAVGLALPGWADAAPGVHATPDPVDFGGHLLGTSTVRQVSLVNSTNNVVRLITVSLLDDNDFSAPSITNVNVFPGGVVAVPVTFQPTKVGAHAGRVLFSSDAGDVTATLAATAGAPKVAAAPSVELPPQHLAAPSASFTVPLQNVGFSNLTIQHIGVAGPDAGDFVATAGAASIPAGQSGGVGVVFAPSQIGERHATLYVTTDDPDQATVAIDLAGPGVAFAQHVAPAALDFGAVDGRVAAGPLLVTFSNDSDAPLALPTLRIDGPYASSFALAGPTRLMVPPHGSADVPVRLTPMTGGHLSATLVALTDGPPTMMVPLRADVVAGSLRLGTTALDLGTFAIGDTAAPQRLVLENAGLGPLALGGVAIEGQGFALTAAAPSKSLAPGERVEVAIVATSGFQGLLEGAVRITADDPMGSPARVALRAVAAQPGISAAPLSLSFDDTPVGVQTAPLAATLENHEAVAIAFHVRLAGDGAADYVTDLPVVIAPPHGSAQVSVRFRPTVPRPRRADLVLTPDDGAHHPVVLRLGGRGLAAHLAVTPAAIDFPKLPLGGFGSATAVTLTNRSSAPLELDRFVASDDRIVVASDATARSLAPGASTRLVVNLSALRAGAVSGQVAILLGGGVDPAASFTVTGEVYDPNQLGPEGSCAVAPRAPIDGGLIALLAFAVLAARLRRR